MCTTLSSFASTAYSSLSYVERTKTGGPVNALCSLCAAVFRAASGATYEPLAGRKGLAHPLVSPGTPSALAYLTEAYIDRLFCPLFISRAALPWPKPQRRYPQRARTAVLANSRDLSVLFPPEQAPLRPPGRHSHRRRIPAAELPPSAQLHREVIFQRTTDRPTPSRPTIAHHQRAGRRSMAAMTSALRLNQGNATVRFRGENEHMGGL